MKEKDVERLLDKFDESSLKDFEFSNKDFKLSLSKRSTSFSFINQLTPLMAITAL